MILIYLCYVLFGLLIAHYAYKQYLKMSKNFDVNEKIDEIKSDNVTVNNIRDFKSEYNTSDKNNEINNFVN